MPDPTEGSLQPSNDDTKMMMMITMIAMALKKLLENEERTR